MKKLLNIIKYFIISAIISCALAVGFSRIILIEHKEQLQENIKQASSSSCEEFKIIELDKMGTNTGGRAIFRPIVNDADTDGDGVIDVQVYCVEPGTELKFTGYTKAKIDDFVSKSSKTSSTSHGCASDPLYYETKSDPYLICTGKHYDQDDTYDSDIYDYNDYNEDDFPELAGVTTEESRYLYDVAFIVSYLPYGALTGDLYSTGKQQAIWLSPICQKDSSSKANSTARAQGESLMKMAKYYKEFYTQVQENIEDGKLGMNPELVSDINDVVLDVDKTENLAKLGPFTIDYVDGFIRDGAYAFAGISDMYLTDAEGNRIELENLIVNGKVYKVFERGDEKREEYTFFSNWIRENVTTDGNRYNENYVDYYAFNKAYPLADEALYPNKKLPEFYVEFECPDEIVGALSLQIEFKYLKCTMEICLRDAIYYQVGATCTHSGYHCDSDHSCGKNCLGTTTINGVTVGLGCDNSHSCSTKNCCYKCSGRTPKTVTDSTPQDALYVIDADRDFVTETFTIEIPTVPMKIGGYVFEDAPTGKESETDGVLGESDKELQNIEVTLYEVNGNERNLATLATLEQENSKATKDQIDDPDDYTRRTNPTLTDKNGYYEFRGVDPMKEYVVGFTYNGQVYMPTEYLEGSKGDNVAEMVLKEQYSSVTSNSVWNETSKATELKSDRDDYDETFASIGSAPSNYETSNSLGKCSNGYNQTFTIYELSGISLNDDGDYEYNPSEQLIDTYLTVKKGEVIESDKLKEGIINTEIKDYIRTERKYPTDLKKQIYKVIAGNDSEIWRKLQYIEDCKISAYTKNQDAKKVEDFDQYPVYDQFTTNITDGNDYPNNSYLKGTYSKSESTYSNHTLVVNGIKNGKIDDERYENFLKIIEERRSYGDNISDEKLEELRKAENKTGNVVYYGMFAEAKDSITYKNVYPGQLNINLGLWKRQQTDIKIEKDIYGATIKINGKTETYRYELREDENFWDVQTRIKSDYYDGLLTRDLYLADYNYVGKNELEVYITYKIYVKNDSQDLLAEVDQIVDYYDETFTYMPDLSWAMYGNKKDKTITPQEYYDIMTENTIIGVGKFKKASSNKFNTSTGGNPSNSCWDLDGYNRIYLNGLDGYQLSTGENAYLYLTFKLDKDPTTGRLDIEEDKHNIAEINGYSTYYKDGTDLPNGVTKDSEDPAGIVDYFSTPGNLTEDDLSGEHNFENDTDRSTTLRIKIDNSKERKISGVVWEDKRDTIVGETEAVIGNGIRDNGELKIGGIKVEMYEVLKDETLKIAYDQVTRKKQETITKSDGSYEFKNFIPGDYIIRFTYGGNDSSAATTNGYNGQDYKSTTYQAGIEQNDSVKTNINTNSTQNITEYYGYNKDTATQNRTDTEGKYSLERKYNYGYDIQKTDSANVNYSDAKDIWLYRMKVNAYSSNNYEGVKYELANILNNNKSVNEETKMIAETGVIVVEGEYNRTNSNRDGKSNNGFNEINYANGNDLNGNYHIQNVDFGLQERPKAALEVNKEVTNVKVKLADNSILTNSLTWKSKTPYNIYQLKYEDAIKGIYNDYGKYDEFRSKIASRVNKRIGTGLIQVTMDEEIMHGATIEITYKIRVTNVGEVDYNEEKFYYTGVVKDENNIVKTSANILIDYVNNNLKYNDSENSGWRITNAQEIKNAKYLWNEVENELKNYNTILTTTKLNKWLIPVTKKGEGSTNTYEETKLVLNQTITPQNVNDNMIYENLVEIIKISNDVGRRMAYSVQGNQKPSNTITEMDSSIAERVTILPPFGILDICLYAGIGIIAAALITTGIIIIKKKVLRK